jgi:hypothetical protein
LLGKVLQGRDRSRAFSNFVENQQVPLGINPLFRDEL